jgi:hypothetical protein
MEIVIVLVGALALAWGLNRWYYSKPRNFDVNGQTYTRHPDKSFTRADGTAITGTELKTVEERWHERTRSNSSDWDDRDYDYSTND